VGDDVFAERIIAPDAAEIAADASASDVQRLWFRVFLTGGLVAVAALVINVVGPKYGVLVLDPLTRQFDALLIASLALLLVATTLVRLAPGWQEVVRVLVILGLSFLLTGAALLGALALMLPEEAGNRLGSPDGRSIVVVSEGNNSTWNVAVQQSSPVLARTWRAACVYNGDDSDYGPPPTTRWLSSTVVEVTAYSGDQYQITVDPGNSKPSATASVTCSD